MSVTQFHQIANNAITTSPTSFSSTGVTSIAAASGTGALFPAPGNGFYVTLWTGSDPSADANQEIVLCTARSGDTLTVGATTKTHASPVNIGLLDVSQITVEMQTAINAIESGSNPVPAGGSLTSPVTVSGASSTAFAVGANGTTNPGLQVDTSPTSSATGLLITANAAAGGTYLTATSTAVQENLFLRGKGSTSGVAVRPLVDSTGAFTVVNAANTVVALVVDTTSTGVIKLGYPLWSKANSATALAIGQNYSTNPALVVDTSTASSATGWNVKSGAAATQAALSVISSGTNENGTINSKGAGILYLNNNATGQISLGSGQMVKRTPVADAAYTVLVSDYVVAYTSLTAGRAITLPTAVGISGQVFKIKDEAGSAGANNITVQTTASQTIDGNSTKVISTNYGFTTLYSNGANWFTI